MILSVYIRIFYKRRTRRRKIFRFFFFIPGTRSCFLSGPRFDGTRPYSIKSSFTRRFGLRPQTEFCEFSRFPGIKCHTYTVYIIMRPTFYFLILLYPSRRTAPTIEAIESRSPRFGVQCNSVPVGCTDKQTTDEFIRLHVVFFFFYIENHAK